VSKYYVGFEFQDNLWSDGVKGEIIARKGGYWEVRWAEGYPEYSSESDESIEAMINGN
jgi:hypothetical protein